jgi:hypothetical protein
LEVRSYGSSKFEWNFTTLVSLLDKGRIEGQWRELWNLLLHFAAESFFRKSTLMGVGNVHSQYTPVMR